MDQTIRSENTHFLSFLSKYIPFIFSPSESIFISLIKVAVLLFIIKTVIKIAFPSKIIKIMINLEPLTREKNANKANVEWKSNYDLSKINFDFLRRNFFMKTGRTQLEHETRYNPKTKKV